MLVSMKEMAELSRSAKRAVGAFYAVNLEQVQGVLEAALEERSPVIIALDEPGAMYAGLGAFLAMTRELAGELPVPVSMILDHARDEGLICNALEAGYTGVLVETRDMPLDRAGPFLGTIKDLCDEQGAFYEVDIGVQSVNDAQCLEMAVSLVLDLKPDSVCVSAQPEDKKAPGPGTFDFLTRLSQVWDSGISLAGAGAWPETDLRKAVGLGVWKISVGTRINAAFTRGLRDYLDANPGRVQPRSFLGPARDALRSEAKRCISLFRT
jgi:fructose-bisphosphate aldolase class II